MSDKHTYHYDKDFEDQAWKKMSFVLDEEMPVKKKKRRFFLLLFLIGIATCGGAIWSGYSTFDLASPVADVMKPNKPLDRTKIKVEPSVKADSDLPSHEMLNTGTTTHSINNITSKKNFEVRKNTSVLNIDHDETQEMTIRPFMQIYNQNFNTQTLNEKFPLENRVITNQDKILEVIEGTSPFYNPDLVPNLPVEKPSTEVLIKTEEQPVKEDHENPLELEPVAYLKTDGIEYADEAFLPLGSKFRKGQWKLGLEIGFVFQNKNELGAKLGFVTTRQFNDRWALHTGLDYQAQFIRYEESEHGNLLSSDLEITSGGMTNQTLDESYIILGKTRINSHFVKVPVLVGYRMNRSFEMNMGLVGSALIYTGKGEISNLVDFSAVSLSPPSTFSKKIEPVYDIQASIGLSYYLNSKWVFNLRYDNGFLTRKLTAKSGEGTIGFKGYNRRYRQLSLSTRMYF